jgi:hypothetical protein
MADKNQQIQTIRTEFIIHTNHKINYIYDYFVIRLQFCEQNIRSSHSAGMFFEAGNSVSEFSGDVLLDQIAILR